MRKHNLGIGGYILGAGGRGTETPVLLLDTPPPLYIWRSYYKTANLSRTVVSVPRPPATRWPRSTFFTSLITLTNTRFLSQHIR